MKGIDAYRTSSSIKDHNTKFRPGFAYNPIETQVSKLPETPKATPTSPVSPSDTKSTFETSY